MDANRLLGTACAHYVKVAGWPWRAWTAAVATLGISACGGFPLAVDIPPTSPPPDEPPAQSVPAAVPESPPSASSGTIASAHDSNAPIALLVSSSIPAYDAVASELTRLAGQDHTLRFLVDGQNADDLVRRVNAARPRATVAIGLDAALLATSRVGSPVVFCQVFNYQEHESLRSAAAAVSALPSFEATFKEWKRMDPTISNVGAIVGPGHEDLMAELREAAAAHNVAIQDKVSRSDQETAYLFRRLAASIDGFVLIPDNRVLSVGVIRDLMKHASERDVQVVAVNPELLALGAVMSVVPSAAHIAEAVYELLEALARSPFDKFKLVLPKSYDVRFNDRATSLFGLEAPSDDPFVVRVH